MADRHAVGLIVNALTTNRGETTDDWLQRNGLDTHLFHGWSCFLHVECGVPYSDRAGRFNGVTSGLLDIQLPVGMDWPSSLADGLAFADSMCQLLSGLVFQQCYIKIWDMHLRLAEPLPSTREGWPLH